VNHLIPLARTCQHVLTPLKPVIITSGKLMLRVKTELLGAALVAAQVKGMSLNQWASQALREAAHM